MVSGLTRVPTWQGDLAKATDLLQATRFKWGSSDCFTGLLRTVAEAVVGQPLVEQWAGTYSSPETALYALSQEGCDDVVEFMDRLLPSVETSYMRAGDIAGIATHDQFVVGLGVCLGEYILAYGPDGYPKIYGRALATKAWKLG